MRVNKKDRHLLHALGEIQSAQSRSHVIDHLGERAAKRLAGHLRGLVLQSPGYKVRNSEEREALKVALAPHKSDLRRFIHSSEGAGSSGGAGTGGGFDHRQMRGGWIFSLILGE